MELEATGPSRIWNAQQTREMLSGDGGETANEVRQLRQDLRDTQGQMAVYMQRTAKILERWDAIGQPEVRSVA